ncbi:MAG: NUDIX domain-containing protein [Anaerolineae bacterium]|nr:NUDIX domain-containing protein [Anaerolineae bacterium]
MLLRNKPPNQGLWNGVGGHIEIGETPYESCLREIKEETGFKLENINFGGILTWKGFEIEEGGLYIFTALAPDGDPLPSLEGNLAWLPKQSVLTSSEIVENIHYFGPAVFAGLPPCRHHFEYNHRTILVYHTLPLPEKINIFEPFEL